MDYCDWEKKPVAECASALDLVRDSRHDYLNHSVDSSSNVQVKEKLPVIGGILCIALLRKSDRDFILDLSVAIDQAVVRAVGRHSVERKIAEGN